MRGLPCIAVLVPLPALVGHCTRKEGQTKNEKLESEKRKYQHSFGKDFVVLALLSNTFSQRQWGRLHNPILTKPTVGARFRSVFDLHGRRRLSGILCLCGHQLHSLLTRSLNVLKSTTAATCGGSFSGASKPILQANIDFTQHFSTSTRHFWKYFVVFPSLLLAGAKTLRRLEPRALGAEGARSRARSEPRALGAEGATGRQPEEPWALRASAPKSPT